jgi:predicted nucleic acid-binding protein
LKYLDTNVIVYAIENHPKYGGACKRILEDIEGGKLRVSCSMLVLVELISVLKKLNGLLSGQGRKELVIEDNIEAVLSLPITWIDLDFLIIEKASAYSFHISGVDYTHVATMEVSSITEILSADGDFDRIPLIKRIDPLGYDGA